MNDSNYYYELINTCNLNISNYRKEREKYVLVSQKLNDLLSKIPQLSQKLYDGEKCYLDGGFISDNETYDRGLLKDCYNTLYMDFYDVMGKIKKIDLKINEIDNLISSEENNLLLATDNYNAALENEKGGV